MPNSQKPIVLICGSRSIDNLNLDLYLNPNSIGEIVTGGATGVDTLAENWAKKNNVEFITYLPNYQAYGKRAPLVRDREMVDYCDVVIGFWDGESSGTAYTLNYAQKMNRKIYLHLIQDM